MTLGCSALLLATSVLTTSASPAGHEPLDPTPNLAFAEVADDTAPPRG